MALVVNALVIGLKFWLAGASGSLQLQASAIHSVSDTATLVFVLLALFLRCWESRRYADGSRIENRVAQGAANRTAHYEFTVIDVRFKQLSFPQANLLSVNQGMCAERDAIARQFRSEGTGQAAKIRTSADANQQAAASQSTQSSITSYVLFNSMKHLWTKTTLILPSDSELLRYLNPTNINVGSEAPTATPQPIATPTSTP